MNGPRWKFTVPPIASAVYLIRRNGQPIYVGQSTCILQRLRSHQILRPGDTVEIEPTELADLDCREQEWIDRYRPELNRAGLVSPYIPPWKRRRVFSFEDVIYSSASNYLSAVAAIELVSQQEAA